MSRLINEITADDLGDIESVVAAQQPLLIRGFVTHWPAVKASVLGFDSAATYLSSQYSGRPLTAYVGKHDIDGRFFYNDDFSDFNFRRGQATLPQVLHKLASSRGDRNAPTVYVGSTMIDEWFPRFNRDNEPPIRREELLASIWIGNRSRVSAHYDFPDNIACVVAGERTFTLFPPEQVKNLYVGPLDVTPSGQEISVVDVKSPDLARFPNYQEAEAEALVAHLQPGDAIFIPSMWWHHVEASSDLNVLVNYWWCESPSYLGTPSLALKHALLAIRDLPAHQKAHWKRLFDHYVFEDQTGKHDHIPEAGRGILDRLDEQSANQLKQFIGERLMASLPDREQGKKK